MQNGRENRNQENQWVKVRARFEFEPLVYEDSRQPVLHLISLEPTENQRKRLFILGKQEL